MSALRLLSPTFVLLLVASQAASPDSAMAQGRGSGSSSKSAKPQFGNFGGQNQNLGRIGSISNVIQHHVPIKTFPGSGSGGSSGSGGGSGHGSGSGHGHGSGSHHHPPLGGCFPTKPWPPHSHCDHYPPVVITVPADPVVVVTDPGVPTAPTNGVPRNQLPGGVAGQRREIWIVNLPENRTDVSYVVGGQTMTTPAGQMQTIPQASAVIEFDRGGMFGQASNSLTSGVYEFQATPQGWQLARKSFAPKFANPGVVDEFSFVVDGKTMSLKAGQGMEFKGDFPVQVTFDQGNGGQPTTRPLVEGEYLLQFDGEKRVLDIIPAAMVKANMPSSGAANVPPNFPLVARPPME